MVDYPNAVADARVTIRFISLEDCPPEFAGEVTRGANTQNRVERPDFVALDPQQDRLATELAIDGLRHAIKSGEPTPETETGCAVIDATVALSCAKRTPDLAVQAKRQIGSLWLGAEKRTAPIRPRARGCCRLWWTESTWRNRPFAPATSPRPPVHLAQGDVTNWVAR
jgi:hypothetical protein